MPDAPADPYLDRMRRVLAYIDANLDRELDLEELANVAAFSKFHFQRQFSSLLGLPVRRYIQLMRLRSAGARLAYRRDHPVTEIALDAGFGSPEAFSRSFGREIGQSPSAFRQAPLWEPWRVAVLPVQQLRRAHMTPRFSPKDVEIIDFEPTPVAVLAHQGDPDAIGDSLRDFIAWRRANGLPPSRSATFNIFHCDPEETPVEEYRLDLCAATNRPIDENPFGVTSGEIPGGRCARLRVTGASDDLRPAVAFLYREWLPASGCEPRDFPVFVQRVSFFPDVPEHATITDVFLPIA